jgi:hypothetical protein
LILYFKKLLIMQHSTFGGRAGKKAGVKYNGRFVDVLQDITPLEISLCENPANPEALIEAVSVAKSEDIKKPDDARPPKEWWERCVARVREEGAAAILKLFVVMFFITF